MSFEQARLIFADPFALMVQDEVIDDEERWRAIGRAELHVVLVVAHVVRANDGEEVVRIISARRALRHERRQYEIQACEEQS